MISFGNKDRDFFSLSEFFRDSFTFNLKKTGITSNTKLIIVNRDQISDLLFSKLLDKNIKLKDEFEYIVIGREINQWLESYNFSKKTSEILFFGMGYALILENEWKEIKQKIFLKNNNFSILIGHDFITVKDFKTEKKFYNKLKKVIDSSIEKDSKKGITRTFREISTRLDSELFCIPWRRAWFTRLDSLMKEFWKKSGINEYEELQGKKIEYAKKYDAEYSNQLRRWGRYLTSVIADNIKFKHARHSEKRDGLQDQKNFKKAAEKLQEFAKLFYFKFPSNIRTID